jgi:hypothetical protein
MKAASPILPFPKAPEDPLKFRDSKKYVDRHQGRPRRQPAIMTR